VPGSSAIAGFRIERGTLQRPQSARELLALPMARAPLSEELEPVALPVLMRHLLARRSISGTLVIEADGFEARAPIIEGGFELDRSEYDQLMAAFDFDEARYRLEPGFDDAHGRRGYSMSRLAVAGLHALCRALPQDELRDAFMNQLERFPLVLPERRPVVRRLGLSQQELRFVDFQLDGEANGIDLVQHAAIGAQRVTIAWLTPRATAQTKRNRNARWSS
jgi:hypothetical protein